MLSLVHTTHQKSRNLILIGFMGTGKTTIGKRVAQSLGFEFVDTDARITRAAGKPITKIFEEDGEDAFRELETKILRECSERSEQVISTGGGIVTQPENRQILETAGFVVWLKASPDTIYERIRHNRSRPLLKTDNPRSTIENLLSERSDLYKASKDLAVTTDGLTLDETCFGVTESARVALGVQ